jgi:phosphate-selective porin OprO/OprP
MRVLLAAILLAPVIASADAVVASEEPQPVAEPAPPPPPAPKPAIDPALIQAIVDERLAAAPKTAGWDDGFYVRTTDGTTAIHIGGYTQFDSRFFADDAADPHTDQFGFRSIRPELKGTVFEHYDFRLLPDFAGGKTVLQDAYVDVHYLDELRLRAGKFKVPFGLERLQRDIYTPFVERGLPSLLTPNRDVGVQLWGEVAHGLVEYELGAFDGVADNASADADTSDHKTGVARVFVHPLAGLGIGGAATYGWESGTLASPLAPQYVTQGQTTFFAYMDGVVSAGRHWRATAQGYYYVGSLGVLAEYVCSVQHVAIGGSNDIATFDAWQGLATYVLTGEPASYAGVVPTHRYGAFEVSARYGELRLVDGNIFDVGFADPTKSAHRARSLGAGVDWYANKAIRVVLDLEHTWYWLGGPSGDRQPETSVVGRVQTSF